MLRLNYYDAEHSKLDVLKRHYEDVGRPYEEIKRRPALAQLNLRPEQTNADRLFLLGKRTLPEGDGTPTFSPPPGVKRAIRLPCSTGPIEQLVCRYEVDRTSRPAAHRSDEDCLPE